MMKSITLFFTLIFLGACSSYNIPDSPLFSSEQQWVIMPFYNYSGTPLAAEQAEEILGSVLADAGVHTTMYQVSNLNSLDSILEPSLKLNSAIKWLDIQKADYIITGSISEWRYKSGLDAEPSVGITLKVKNAATNKVLWQATGARSGWGRENLAHTGMNVLNQLVAGLRLE